MADEMKSTILFSDEFTKHERVLLTKTFKANVENLGIALEKFDVLFHKRDIGKPRALGSMSRLGDGLFSFTLNDANSIADSIFATGHETVHVRQYIRGEIRDDDYGVYWHNYYIPALFCTNSLYYNLLPWEIEAHALQYRLYEKALAALKESQNLAVKNAITFFRAQAKEGTVR